MKTEILANPIFQSESLDSSTNSLMSIDASGIGMATLFLRDKIYSNKIGAVVREYTCNALDEHSKHNISVPVRIELTEETFSVRDYAQGLDESSIRNIFGMYFKSTKSSDNSQVGGFGIGSKSGHCYTDTFYVKSYHNGICTLYACVLGGKEGIPVGQIIEIDKTETSETGLEVFLNIYSSDFSKFVSEIRNFVLTSNQKIEFHYTTVDMDGNEVNLIITPKTPIFESQRGDYTVKVFSDISYSPYIYKMGNVQYGIPTGLPENIKFNPQSLIGTGFINNRTIVIDIPIGKLSLPISRESFENTPDNIKVLQEIKNLVADIRNEEFAQLANISLKELLELVRNNKYATSNNSKVLLGNLFNYSFKSLFVNYNDVISSFKVAWSSQEPSSDSVDFVQSENKSVVVLIPDNKYSDSWISRLLKEVKVSKKKYYFCREDVYVELLSRDDTLKSQMEELFVTKSIRDKSIGIPPLVREKKSVGQKYYNVYHTTGYSKNSTKAYRDLSPLEIHNRISSKKIDDEASVKPYIENLAKNALSCDDFSKFSISFVKTGETAPQGLWTHSIKMFNNMLELGWYNADGEALMNDSQECIKRSAEIYEIRKLKSLTEYGIIPQNIKDKFTTRMNKKHENISRIKKVLENLNQEQSLRGIVWRAMNKNGQSVERNKIRAILKLTEV